MKLNEQRVLKLAGLIEEKYRSSKTIISEDKKNKDFEPLAREPEDLTKYIESDYIRVYRYSNIKMERESEVYTRGLLKVHPSWFELSKSRSVERRAALTDDASKEIKKYIPNFSENTHTWDFISKSEYNKMLKSIEKDIELFNTIIKNSEKEPKKFKD